MEKSEFEFTFLYFKVYYCGSESHKQPIPYHTQIHCLYRDNIHSFISRTPWLLCIAGSIEPEESPLTTHLLPDSESRLAITIEPALIIMGSIFKDYQDSERNCEPQLLPCLSQGEKKVNSNSLFCISKYIIKSQLLWLSNSLSISAAKTLRTAYTSR